jgi:predicted nucleotidyltransferase
MAVVGSVANGTCKEDSDIDMAVFCEQDLCEELSKGTAWISGRPSEAIIDNTQLHYYVVSYEAVEDRLDAHDDLYIYNYSNMIVLHNPGARMERLKSSLLRCRSARAERAEANLTCSCAGFGY